ncbi:hypothetical protein LV92_03814 [Arenibacter echinorum]|uniref:Uncharacterized protein n=1 Tax=Arenibacter echinorum TaxID=440515 RepID=A0A327QU94_9FLAO|nr:hypothetical protein LV92_03814 [Arenibacter echinorum]
MLLVLEGMAGNSFYFFYRKNQPNKNQVDYSVLYILGHRL